MRYSVSPPPGSSPPPSGGAGVSGLSGVSGVSGVSGLSVGVSPPGLSVGVSSGLSVGVPPLLSVGGLPLLSVGVSVGVSAVSYTHLEAVEVVLVGKEKKDRILSAEERKIVSYHEVGHALVSALQKDSEPVQKITIVPRTMGALGYVMHVPEEEKFLNTRKELEAMLVGYLGGRAAEEIVFDTVTTGAANDIEQATKVARAMITQYGMSDRFGLMGLADTQSQYLDCLLYTSRCV